MKLMKKKQRNLRIFNLILLILILSYIGFNLLPNILKKTNPSLFIEKSNAKIKYIALGDSYTIGEGISKQDNWPSQLTKQLQEKGIDIDLIANPSKTGWTTQDLIEYELPIYKKSDANLVSIQIGVNDYVQGISSEEFRRNFIYILEEVQKREGVKIFVLNIPDYSKTPNGQKYIFGRDTSSDILLFNKIIEEETSKRNINLIDIHRISNLVENESKYLSQDKLHYSKEMYSLWVEKIINEVNFKN